MSPNRIVNYTNLKDSDRRIYNIFGYPIPGGIEITFLIISILFLIVFNLVGYPLSVKLGIKYFDFSRKKYFYGFFMIVFPFISAFLTYKIKIQNYTLYEYLFHAIIQFIRPKNSSLHEASNNYSGRIGYFIDDIL